MKKKKDNNIFKEPDGLKLLIGITLFLVALIFNSNYFENNNVINSIGIVLGIVSFIIIFLYIKEEKNYNYMSKMAELYKQNNPQKYEKLKKSNKDLEEFDSNR